MQSNIHTHRVRLPFMADEDNMTKRVWTNLINGRGVQVAEARFASVLASAQCHVSIEESSPEIPEGRNINL